MVCSSHLNLPCNLIVFFWKKKKEKMFNTNTPDDDKNHANSDRGLISTLTVLIKVCIPRGLCGWLNIIMYIFSLLTEDSFPAGHIRIGPKHVMSLFLHGF
jgi:hypothetical protein